MFGSEKKPRLNYEGGAAWRFTWGRLVGGGGLSSHVSVANPRRSSEWNAMAEGVLART